MGRGNQVAAVVVFALLAIAWRPAAAQEVEALAKQTQNPVSSLISLPFQGNWVFGLGDDNEPGTLLNVQPVLPFAVSTHTNVILRIIMPLASQPGAADSRINGFGDIVATAFFSPSKPGRLTWGVGPVVLLPSATDALLGSEKFGIGPSVVALMQPGHWTVGVLMNQIWSVSGAADRPPVNSTFLQPFTNYNLGEGLSVGVTSEASGNWEAEQVWTAPVLFNVSKVTKLGTRPVNFQVAAGPMVASPDGGANWQFRLVSTFLFPR